MDQDGSSFVAQIDAMVHVYRSRGRVYAIGDWGGGTIAPATHSPNLVAIDGSFPGPATVCPTEWLRRRPHPHRGPCGQSPTSDPGPQGPARRAARQLLDPVSAWPRRPWGHDGAGHAGADVGRRFAKGQALTIATVRGRPHRVLSSSATFR